MGRRPKRALLIVVVLSGAVIVGVKAVGQATVAQMTDLIQPPATWLPYTATIQRLEDGALRATYVESRFADGSARRESLTGQYAEILDVGTRRYFRKSAGGREWVQHPSREQPNGGRPYRVVARDRVSVVSPFDSRVAALTNAGAELTFYEHRSPNGTATTILCPELNMADVWRSYQMRFQDGRVVNVVQRYVSLVVGDPVEALTPPSDAPIVVSTTPDGPGRVTGSGGGRGRPPGEDR